MKIIALKSIILFSVILLLAFSFPFQVLMLSPYPALAPYFFMVLIFILLFIRGSYDKFLLWDTRRPIIIVLGIYSMLVIFNTAWQVIFNFISIENAITALVTFLFPILFFVYFRTATVQEIRIVLYAISISGLFIGVHFMYDSYSMLVLRKVSDYSFEALEYSQFRGPGQTINDARIGVGSRSMGLLENHSITATWIVLGCLSTLTLLPDKQFIKRAIVIFIYGLFLLNGLNFTSIVGFTFVILLMEFRSYTLLRGAISKKLVLLILIVICSLIFVILTPFLLNGLN